MDKKSAKTKAAPQPSGSDKSAATTSIKKGGAGSEKQSPNQGASSKNKDNKSTNGNNKNQKKKTNGKGIKEKNDKEVVKEAPQISDKWKRKPKEPKPPKSTRRYAKQSLWDKVKRYFCFCCIKELPQKPYRRIKLGDEQIKKLEIIEPVKVKTNDDSAVLIQKTIRGFVGRARAKKAWRAAFSEVDTFWGNVLQERNKARDEKTTALQARRMFVDQYVADILNTSYVYLVQSHACRSIQSHWRGYWYRSRFPRPRKVMPIRWKPRKIQLRWGPEVYRRVWARKQFVPEGGWPCREEVLEYDIFQHADQPPAGPDFGLRVYKVKAPGKSERDQILMLNDRNAWIGFPVYLDTAHDRELQRRAKWSHLEYITATRSPFLTKVVNLEEIKPPVLEGLDLLQSLGWRNPRPPKEALVDKNGNRIVTANKIGITDTPEERERLVRSLTRLDKAFKEDGTLVDNILDVELSAAYAANEFAYSNELKSGHSNSFIRTVGKPLRSMPPPPDHSGLLPDLGNTVTENSLTKERIVVPSFNSLVMETPNRGAYKPLSYLHKDAPQRVVPLQRNPDLTDDEFEEEMLKMGMSFREVQTVRTSVLNTVDGDGFRGTDGPDSLLELTSYRPKNAPIQFSMDPFMQPVQMLSKFEREPSRSLAANSKDGSDWQSTPWGQLKTGVELATSSSKTLADFLDPNQATEIAFSDEDVWSRALHKPKQVIKSKAKVWSAPAREHYSFRYSWLPQPMVTPLSRPGSARQQMALNADKSYYTNEGQTTLGSSYNSPEKSSSSSSDQPIKNNNMSSVLSPMGRGDRAPVPLQGKMGQASISGDTNSRNSIPSRWGKSAMSTVSFDQQSFYTEVEEENEYGDNITFTASTSGPQQETKSQSLNLGSSTREVHMDMILNSRSRAIDRVDVYPMASRSASDVQLSELTSVVRSEMNKRLDRQRIALLKVHSTNNKKYIDNQEEGNSFDDLDLDVGVSAYPSMDSFSSHVLSNDPLNPFPQSISGSAMEGFSAGPNGSTKVTLSNKALMGNNKRPPPPQSTSPSKDLHPFPFY